jgi:hypothetical protein
MKFIFKSLLVLAFLMCLTKTAQAQTTKYQGSYYLYSGYYSQKSSAYPVTATFGLGVATISSKGQASYTCYFPFEGAVWNGYQYVPLSAFQGSGTGVVSSRGVFSLNNGVSGNCQLWGSLTRGRLAIRSVGLGTFEDGYGTGIFGVIKYQ